MLLDCGDKKPGDVSIFLLKGAGNRKPESSGSLGGQFFLY